MKKWTILVAVLVILSALTACNPKDTPGTSSSKPGTSTPNTSQPGTSTPNTSQPGTSTPNTSGTGATYKDGTYEAEEKGYAGPIKVEVKVENKKISGVRIVSHTETEGVGTKAIEELPAKIVQANAADVDVVSGATVTSDAIKKAVSSALAKASNQ